MNWLYGVIALIWISLSGCSRDKPEQPWGRPMFSEIPSALSGIFFDNQVNENKQLNGVNFSYTYNGSGVCATDLNNDDLPDLIFCGNQTGPIIYENLGHFRFKQHVLNVPADDKNPSWFTGVSSADINNDGKFDIYICRSGPEVTVRRNLLFINMGNFRFKECAAAFKLDDPNPSTQGIFFDADKDGDEDCLVINHPSDFTHILNPYAFSDSTLMIDGADQLYLNNGDSFINVTEQWGLKNSRGFALSAQIADFNQDGWPDIWVANDYISNDQIWLNLEGKGFSEATKEMIRSSSLFSMGTDHGDLNNDGLIDLAVADMKPDNHLRTKKNLISLPLDYYSMIDKNFQPSQRIKNSIYLGSTNNRYVECSQALGLDKTDWSWSMIMEDLDLDGFQDILVTNGTLRDLHDLDFIMLQESAEQERDYSHKPNEIYKNMPVSHLSPYVFRNKGQLQFQDETKKWGLHHLGISSGAAIADLDADGDWDLIVSRSGEPAGVYRNNTMKRGIRVASSSRYQLSANPAPANLFAGSVKRTFYPHTMRGYASQSENILIIPEDQLEKSDSIEFVSGLGERCVIYAADYPKNNHWKVEHKPFKPKGQWKPGNFKTPCSTLETIIPSENTYNQDLYFSIFKIHRLIPEDPLLLSPKIRVREYECGKLIAYSHPKGIMLVIDKAGKSMEPVILEIPQNKRVVTDFQWIQVPGSNNPVLAVGSASYILDTINSGLKFWELKRDRSLREMTFPKLRLPGNIRCLAVSDLNKDGIDEVFAGGACMPWNYPAGDISCLVELINGLYSSRQIKIPENLPIDAACWYSNSPTRFPSLFIALRYGGIYKSDGKNLGCLKELTPNIYGRWNNLICYNSTLNAAPLIVVCGEGTNNYPPVSIKNPMRILSGDFDKNTVFEPLVLHSLKSNYGLFADRNSLCEQMPSMRNYFHTYKSYATGNPFKYIDTSLSMASYNLNSSANGLLKPDKNGKYRWIPLESEVSLDAWSDAVLLPESNWLLMGISAMRKGIPSSPLGAEQMWELVNITNDKPAKERRSPVISTPANFIPGQIGISTYGMNSYLLTDGRGGLYRFTYP